MEPNTKAWAWISGAFVALIIAMPLFQSGGTTAPAPDEIAEATVEADVSEPAAAPEPTAITDPFLLHVQETTGRLDGARVVAADTEPGNWLAHGRTYSEQRFSPLDQINTDTVGDLALEWSFDTGTNRGLEASPIVVDGVMYATGSWSTVYALNAKTGEAIWEYDPEVPRAWGRHACCDVVNRGVAVWKGKVYVGTIDGRLVALDATTGEVAWDVNTIDRTKPYTITGAPRIVKDKVIIGNGGAELGVRGYFTAYDAETGEEVWRFYTAPGDPAKPYEHQELEWAAETWTGDKYWDIGGGGTVWDSMAYDADLDLLYVGTGNSSPWNRYVRSPGGGDNLFVSSILAIDPDTGKLIWYYQTTPGDSWDYTATQHIVLADMEWNGEARKLLLQAPKNGFFYVLDRETGELLSAEKYVNVTWATHVDMNTGRPVEDPAFNFKDEVKLISPGPQGGHNWHPMAFSPTTGLVYIPAMEMPSYYNNKKDWEPEHNAWNLGIDWKEFGELAAAMMAEGPEPAHGYLKAWDPIRQKEVWSVEHPGHINGGVLATAGNLIFQGTGDGRFVAYRADTGERIWEAPVLTGMIAPPVSYAVDGEQYVAIMAGYGGIAISQADPRASGAAKFRNDGRMLVFKLGGTGALPALEQRDETITVPPEMPVSEEALAHGQHMYSRYCGVCHGALAISSGVLPDLRRMGPETHEMFQEIVRGGLYELNGMPNFGDNISEADVTALQAYIISQANATRVIAPAEGEAEAP